MKKIFIAFFIFLSINIQAQPGEKTDIVTYTIHLRNGDILTGTTKTRNIIVSTEYGTLGMPIKNISQIKFGIKNPLLERDLIDGYINKLYSAKPEEQKWGFEMLGNQEVGAISILTDFINSEKNVAVLNQEYSPENALKILKGVHNIDNLTPINDIISYDDKCVIEGTCNFGGDLAVETQFGLLSIPRKNISVIDVFYNANTEAENANKLFNVLANKNISSNNDAGFLNTGVSVKIGSTISISATGKVTLASLSGNTYTPDGGVNGAPAPNDGGTNAPSYGGLVFKIGENGPVQKAGSNLKVKANADGIIYFAIYETVFDPKNAGSFKVKLKVE
jgi:hypothetical protein